MSLFTQYSIVAADASVSAQTFYYQGEENGQHQFSHVAKTVKRFFTMRGAQSVLDAIKLDVPETCIVTIIDAKNVATALANPAT